MPSNEKLIDSIKEIDENFNHEGQSNADMVAVLKCLRLQKSILELDENADIKDKDVNELTAMLEELKPDAEAEAAKKEKAEAVKKEKAEAAKKASDKKLADAKAIVAKKPPYEIAKGKAITTKRGILAEGDEIKAKDLSGGKEALESFVETGHVIKN